VELRGAHLDRERAEVLAGVGRDRPLDEAEVARADHPDPPVVPGLLAQPAERREPVGALVEGAELAAGAERAADALDDDLEPALGEQPPEDEAEELPAPVRGADEHRRLGHLPGGAGDPAVGEQDRAVVGGDGEVLLADDVVRPRARQAHAPGEDLAREADGPIVVGPRRPS